MDEALYFEPNSDQQQDLHDAVVDAVTALADRISVAYSGLDPDDLRWSSAMSTPAWQLTMLRALREVEPLAQTLGERWARTAGVLGATYTQLGSAAGISRQAATKRWPGAVPVADPQPITIEVAGGTARVFYDQASAAWSWAGEAGNGHCREAPDDATYTSSAESAAAAGAWLAVNTTAEEPNR